jgi:hydrogenase nickel incorporation protein HypB
MFAAASLLLINKTDLLPHVDFDVAQCIGFARRVNPGVQVLQVSATRGTGMDAWLDWLLQTPPKPARAPGVAAPADAAALHARIAALEAQLAALQGPS